MRKDEYGVRNAVRPWLSADSVPEFRFGEAGVVGGQVGHHRKDEEDQKEIEACLHCPFPSCEGTANKCHSFRAKYIAKLEHRS